ncbi:ATP-dependent DNA ligase [Pseudomonas putida]|nr:ATP-dependent DNA ligase [Pseudomonas putida]
MHWLKPQLLAEVAYAQMTREGIVRHSVFHGLRDDKPATAIDLSERCPPSAQHRHDPRAWQPAPDPPRARGRRDHRATKRQVAQYYAQVADRLLRSSRIGLSPWSGHRMAWAASCSSRRTPATCTFPTCSATARPGRPGGHGDQPRRQLLGAVQMNTLELHTWNATNKDFDKPDRFVLDLDPDPALP